MTPSKSKMTAASTVSVREQQPRRALHVRFARKVELFERRRIWNRRIECSDNPNGCVEKFEGFFLDDGGDAFADAAGSRILVDDQDAVTTAREGKDRGAVERHEAAQVKDAGMHAVLRERIGHARGDVDVGTIRNDRQVIAVTPE